MGNGDFTRIAESMRESGEALVKDFRIKRGFEVWDVGCGDGTTAISAAKHGEEVLGVYLARNIIDAGNQRAKLLTLAMSLAG